MAKGNSTGQQEPADKKKKKRKASVKIVPDKQPGFVRAFSASVEGDIENLKLALTDAHGKDALKTLKTNLEGFRKVLANFASRVSVHIKRLEARQAKQMKRLKAKKKALADEAAKVAKKLEAMGNDDKAIQAGTPPAPGKEPLEPPK